ncbi:MAG: serine/threonine protein phosphatase [Syntrophobacterales bacterium]|nr:serine/threonine protein phosphatase [Syntrophobacterales bacterium]
MALSRTLKIPYRHIFAIGDIHGHVKKLKKLLAEIPYDLSQDILIFLGDYIDRGPASKFVVETVMDLWRRSERVICLRGNHEQMFLDFLRRSDTLLFLLNGGKSTLESYGYEEDLEGHYRVYVPFSHVDFFRSLPCLVEIDQYVFVHGGLRPNLSLDEQTEEDLLWIRHEFIFSRIELGKRVVFGHTPFYEPLVMEDKIGIDTGAGYGRKLTCIQLPEEIFYFAW